MPTCDYSYSAFKCSSFSKSPNQPAANTAGTPRSTYPRHALVRKGKVRCVISLCRIDLALAAAFFQAGFINLDNYT